MSGKKTEKRLRTFVSAVFHREAEEIKEFPTKEEQLFLLDDLLGGGLVIPQAVLDGVEAAKAKSQKIHRPMFVLLAGPPGSGKSTLALELCYRLAVNGNPDIGEMGKYGLSSIFVSVESEAQSLIQNATSFGWGAAAPKGNLASERIVEAEVKAFEKEQYIRDRKEGRHIVCVFGRERLRPQSEKWSAKQYLQHMGSLLGDVGKGGFPIPPVIVIDSLNVLSRDTDPDEVLTELTNVCPPQTLLLIAVLEVDLESQDRPYWPYYADVVIRMGYQVELDYMTRTIEIVKARYQDHADGRHRLKINQGPQSKELPTAMAPLIREGGVCLFPSIHRLLSVAKRITRRQTVPVPTPFRALNEIIQSKGFPAGKCTAIVGSRGGMKSHLAYYTLLKFLADNPDERAVVVSLRDDEYAATDTLAQIAANQRNEEGQPLVPSLRSPNHEKDLQEAMRLVEKQLSGTPGRLGQDLNDKLENLRHSINQERLVAAREFVQDYLEQGRLEILFFWPGYIPPEEFFHLVLLAVDRKPKDKKPASVVVLNGLEQLDARFPLCAREKMFVSGLITLLSAKGITSIAAAGGDPSGTAEHGGVSGLLPMADLIVESSFCNLPSADVWSEKVWGADCPKVSSARGQNPEGNESHVVYQVVRGPGARECRRRVLFYMGRDGDQPPLIPGSVAVRSLPDDFPYGERL